MPAEPHPTAPLLLAIETSGRHGSVAIGRGTTLLAEHDMPVEGRRHAQTLVAAIRSILDESGHAPGDVDAVAVSVGPGSFTGLRVGVVAAKTFAYATGCRLVAVDTFDVVAAGVPREAERFLVLDDAQRGDLFVARYERDAHGVVHRTGPIAIEPANVWFEELRSDEIVVGPGGERFAVPLAERGVRTDTACAVPLARTMLEPTGERIARGEFADPVALEPRYLRRSSAEVKWDERRTGATAD